MNKNNLSIFEALVAGLYFCLFASWPQNINALPLLDFYPIFIQSIVFPILSMAAIILILFQKKYFKSFLIVAILNLLIIVIYRYSAIHAFRSFCLFILMLPLVFERSNQHEKRAGSIFIISTLFIFAGIQKIHLPYLAGEELISGSPFMSYVDAWFPGMAPQAKSHYLTILAYFSIIVELAIGIGILLRPKFFSHMAAFFMLVICFINPPILTVYFLVFPLLLLANEDISDFLEQSSARNLLVIPFFWAFLIYILIPNSKSFEAALGRSYLFTVILIAMHLYVLFFSNKKGDSPVQLNDLQSRSVQIIPSIMLIILISSYFFLPSPFGFKMFSGKRFQVGVYELKITNSEACHFSLRKWSFVTVTDAALIMNQNSCNILFPTMGGITFAANRLCNINPGQIFTIKSYKDNIERPMNCSDF